MTDQVATIDFTKIKADSSVVPEVLEVYQYLKLYMDQQARQEWIKRRDTAWKAIENEMWDDKEKGELKKMGQVPLVINKVNKGVQGSAAIVTDQKPEVKFFPVGSSDLYVAELLKRAHDFVWAKNDGLDIVYDGVEESKVGAIGFFGANHDPSKGIYGRILIYEEPPDDIYWDKDAKARDLSDSHLIKAKMRTKGYIKENYEEIKDEDLFFEQGAKEESGTSTGRTGKDNYKSTEDQTPDTQGGVYQEPANIWEIEAWMLKTVKEHWVIIASDGKVDAQKMEFDKAPSKEEAKAAAEAQKGEYWPRKLEKRIQRIIVGKKLVSEIENPYGEDADGDPVLGIIPLPHQRTRTAYPMSPTNYAVPINKEKNKRRAQFIYAASQNVNAPIVEPAGKVKWTDNPGTPGSRAKVDQGAAFQLYRLQAGSIDIHKFVELEQLADKDIDDQYDLHDVMRGKIPAGQDNMAGRTVLALQDLGGMMSKPFLRKLESALIKLGKLDMALILRHWPREMWERLLEDDEKPPDGTQEAMEDETENPEIKQMVIQKYQKALERIRPKDPTQPPGISLIDLDVRITAGSSMPTNRMAKQQVAIEMVNAGVYDAEAALEYTDDPMKDKVVARLKTNQQLGLEQKIK